MRVIVLGANGMIGSTLFKVMREKSDLNVWGTLRSMHDRWLFSESDAKKLIEGVEASRTDSLLRVFSSIRPDVVINCIGLTKHRPEADDLLQTIELNTLLPHRLARICAASGARLVHVSTDCVFLGKSGGYVESDIPDAQDFYGKSKSMGEVIASPHAITLRTSTIGHELNARFGLLEWFLSQQGQCKGFSRAIFSGLPTVVFAQIVQDVVLPRPELSGLYHVSGPPISKLELLELIAGTYKKKIDIVPDDSLVIDRSLSSARFSMATGYAAPDWKELIHLMHARRLKEYA